MHILLIEPDVILSKIYIQAIERAGHIVSYARGAQSAIMAADAKRPDVVVLEMQLAEHSGAAFLYEFRSYRDWMHIPIIIHTLIPPDSLLIFEQTFKEMDVSAKLYKPQTSLRRLISEVQALAPILS